jgi:hypothetical protein
MMPLAESNLEGSPFLSSRPSMHDIIPTASDTSFSYVVPPEVCALFDLTPGPSFTDFCKLLDLCSRIATFIPLPSCLLPRLPVTVILLAESNLEASLFS